MTLKSVQNGLYSLEIKKPYGSIEYKKIESTKLYDFIQAHDFYCEANNYNFIFLIDTSVKKYVKTRLKELEQRYNNKSTDA
jgi:hypothetical protein